MKDEIDRLVATAVRDAERIKLPIPNDFDEGAYLRENTDVARAIAAGQFQSGYSHYILCGRNEGRSRPTLLPTSA